MKHEIKFLEIRDRATCILVMAMKLNCHDLRENAVASWYLRKHGHQDTIMITRLADGETHFDPYDWINGRTKIAMKFITDNYDYLNDGEVVDVRFISGEATTPAISERFGG